MALWRNHVVVLLSFCRNVVDRDNSFLPATFDSFGGVISNPELNKFFHDDRARRQKP